MNQLKSYLVIGMCILMAACAGTTQVTVPAPEKRNTVPADTTTTPAPAAVNTATATQTAAAINQTQQTAAALPSAAPQPASAPKPNLYTIDGGTFIVFAGQTENPNFGDPVIENGRAKIGADGRPLYKMSEPGVYLAVNQLVRPGADYQRHLQIDAMYGNASRVSDRQAFTLVKNYETVMNSIPSEMRSLQGVEHWDVFKAPNNVQIELEEGRDVRLLIRGMDGRFLAVTGVSAIGRFSNMFMHTWWPDLAGMYVSAEPDGNHNCVEAAEQSVKQNRLVVPSCTGTHNFGLSSTRALRMLNAQPPTRDSVRQ